ncbi:hypothetical protein Tco_0546711 [Tanacetum coccineum]
MQFRIRVFQDMVIRMAKLVCYQDIGNGICVAATGLEGTVQSRPIEGMLLYLQTAVVDCSKRKKRNPTPSEEFDLMAACADSLMKLRKSMQTAINDGIICSKHRHQRYSKPIPEPHQVQQMTNVIPDISGVAQEGEQ